MSPAGAGFWAIKIMDRQPRKKLPGVKKLMNSQPSSTEEAKQVTLTNEKLVEPLHNNLFSQVYTDFVRKLLRSD
jgi:hypothetical protein